MISSEQINLRLADRCHEGDPRTFPVYAHHGVRARVDGRAVSTSMIHGPTVDEQAYSVSGVPHDLYAVQIRQIKDDALAPNGTHYKIPSGEGVGMIKLHLPYPPGREQRGRDRSLSPQVVPQAETRPLPELGLIIHGRTAGALTRIPFFFPKARIASRAT